MCLSHFNFDFLGEIPHFVVSNHFIRHILDGNGIRFADALLVGHHENKNVGGANPLFLKRFHKNCKYPGDCFSHSLQLL